MLHSFRTKLGLILVLAALLATLLPHPVSAQSPVALNPSSGTAGSQVTASGTGFAVGHTVKIQWDDGSTLATTTIGSNGTFSTSFTVPAKASAGQHTVTILDSTGNLAVFYSVGFTVTAASPPTPTPIPPTPTPTPSPSSRLCGSDDIMLNPAGLNFGNQQVGTTSGAQSATFSINCNPVQLGSGPVISVNIQDASGFFHVGTPSNEFTLTSNACQHALVTINQGCTVSVAFSPSTNGALSAWLVFLNKDDQFMKAWPLTGTGVPAAGAQPTPTPALPANCAGDEAMSFNPSNPAAGQQVTAMVTSAQPSANVQLNGPFNPQGPSVSRGGKGYIWSWTFTPDSQGQYTYGFTVNGGGTCTSGTLTVGQPTQQNQPQPTSGCAGDEAMSFNPANPTVGQQVTISVTSARASVFVGLSGPFNPAQNQTTTGGKGNIWSWTVTPDSPGQYNYNFTVNNGANLCTSNFVVVGGPTATPTVVSPSTTPAPSITPVFYCGGAWKSCQGKQRPLGVPDLCYVPPQVPALKKDFKVVMCNLYIASAISLAGLTMAEIYALEFAGPVIESALHIDDLEKGYLDALWRAYLDPPDPNYAVIDEPSFPTTPPIGASGSLTQQQTSALSALLTNLAQQTGYANALATSINRSQGASAAGAADWEARQQQAAREYAANLAGLADSEPGLLTAARPALQAVLPSKSLSVADVTSIQAQIRANGLPAAFAQALTSIGADSGDLDGIKSIILASDPSAAASLTGGNLASALADPAISDLWRQLAQGLREYSNSDARYFPQTGFAVDNDTIWDYFVHRGGVATFGYPTSRTFNLQGFTVQFFQRRIIQLDGNGQARLLNVLDPGLLPYTAFNGSTVPGVDNALVSTAPPATDLPSTLAFVRQHAPDTIGGASVNFNQTFNSTVSAQTAFPAGGGDSGLLPGFDLEMWGLPTSGPMIDPNNHNFIFQRFQRGVMHYDASCSCTQGLLLADYLRAIITGQNLPADVAGEAQNSPLYQQYDKNAPHWVHDPNRLPNTDLTNAFETETQ